MNRFLVLVFLLLVACSGGDTTPSVTSDAPDAAPHREVAYRLHYGPYQILPGAEGVKCFTEPGPSEAMWVSAWHSKSTGTHHVNIWQNEIGASYPTPATCAHSGIAGTGFFGVDRPETTIDLAEAPENAGVAFELRAASSLLWDVHEINTTSSPKDVEVNAEFYRAVRHDLVAHGFSLNNSKSLYVAPGATTTLTYETTSPAEEVRILTIGAHVHAHNHSVIVTMNGSEVYRSMDATSPPLARYDSLHGGMLTVPPSSKVTWSCEVRNTLTVALQNTNAFQTGEMCIVYGLLVGPKWSYQAP